MRDSQTSALVLIADDNPLNLELLSSALTPEGLDVAVTGDGNGVLAIVSHEEPDLILLDALMPGLDGFETCRRLKADPTTRDIPVIFMTSLSEMRYRIQGFSAGAVDYVTKPFEHAELLARVRTQISLRQATRALQEKNGELEKEIQERAVAQQALTNVVSQLERRTEDLRQAQVRLVKLEKQATEIRMAGGFAHEMRNALASAAIRLHAMYRDHGDHEACVCYDIGDMLKELFLLSQAHLPAETLSRSEDLIRGIYKKLKLTLTGLSGISSDIDRALKVTGKILDYSQQGSEPPGSSSINAVGLINSVLRGSEQRLTKQGISVTVNVEPGCVLLGSDNHFYSILNNLILNAQDAIAEVTDDRPKVIGVKLQRAQGGLLLQVTDTGVGIAQENLPKIFEPFFSTNPNSGTGLGLSIVEKLVSLYSGTIDVQSEVNCGSTVNIRFPGISV